MTIWSEILSKHLKNLSGLYKSNELAFLALTQKIEHTIRDRLAFSLYQDLGDSMGLICREWKRVDLAVIHDPSPSPSLMLEAKAIYTFDILTNGASHGYPKQIDDDVKKVRLLGTSQTEIFTLLLATHPHEIPNDKYKHAIKYFGDVTKFTLRRHNNSIEEANEQVKHRLSDHPGPRFGVIEAGKAFDIPVSVAYWLFGPYK